MNTLTVSALNNQIKSLLESTFERVSVEGEVSNVTYHSSGHVYFSLKDKDSAIKCVMFKANALKLKFKIEAGVHLVCDAALSVFVPRGDYQLNCFGAIPAGSGALALAYEQLKKKLQEKGYFEEARKKSLPKFPKKIVIITSATGAAIQDMLKVANKRWSLLKIILINTLVQGENASYQIANGIKYADALGCDAIVIGRGGGGIEDLWAFNEEIVADAIFGSKTPIISAVGHESDFVISDFVSDKRAPTPSAAMEILLPDKTEMLLYLDSLQDRLNDYKKSLISKKTQELINLKKIMKIKSMSSRIKLILDLAQATKKSATLAKNYFLNQKKSELELLNQKLIAADPSKKLLPNSAQIVKDGKSISLSLIKENEIFFVVDSSVKIKSKALGIEKI